jgi:hypothetical protein
MTAAERRESFRIAGQGFWQHLDRYLTSKLRVRRTIDLAHATLAVIL